MIIVLIRTHDIRQIEIQGLNLILENRESI